MLPDVNTSHGRKRNCGKIARSGPAKQNIHGRELRELLERDHSGVSSGRIYAARCFLLLIEGATQDWLDGRVGSFYCRHIIQNLCRLFHVSSTWNKAKGPSLCAQCETVAGWIKWHLWERYCIITVICNLLTETKPYKQDWKGTSLLTFLSRLQILSMFRSLSLCEEQTQETFLTFQVNHFSDDSVSWVCWKLRKRTKDWFICFTT